MSLTFPARFMLADAINPCRCGYFNDQSRQCQCTRSRIRIAKVSGPSARSRRYIEGPAIQYKELRSSASVEGSLEIRDRVHAPMTAF
jgi:magnesium chelatase family protein